MIRASVTYAKNNLSRLLQRVRRGESVWITDRDTVIAALVPVRPDSLIADERIAGLIREGLVTPPRSKLDTRSFVAEARPGLRSGVPMADTLSEDREERA